MLLGRALPLVLALVKLWRRLPRKQRRSLLRVARRHGPRVALRLLELSRSRLARASRG
ncbi:MAG TPA: hypothetical protein VNJ46_05770 [Gaiellaceae bacterium]|nr:hypothetical protein [Gaiellaceae bacterium]